MFDPSDDFLTVADGLEPITLLRRGNASAAAGVSVPHALRRILSVSEASIITGGDVNKKVPGGGHHTAADIVWHLPIAELTEEPRLGDAIIDGDGERWTILNVKRLTFGSRWRCEARNVAIAFGLDDTISVLKASYTKSPYGAAVPLWRLWKSGIRARIQPWDVQSDATTETHGSKVRYRIFIEEALDLDHTCCIRGPDGTVYTVIKTSGAERIGELQTIEVRVMR